MGLLDIFDTAEGQQALGLLAAGSARSDGAGFGQRLSEAVGHTQKWKQQQQAMEEAKQMAEFRKQQMQQQMEQIAQAKAAREQATLDSGAVRSAFAPVSGGAAMANGAGPTVANAQNIGQTPQFNPGQFLQQNPGASLGALKQAMELNASINPSPKREAYGPDQTVIEWTPQGPKEVLKTPGKPASLPTSVQEFEYGAKTPGFTNWMENQKRAGATNVTTKVETKMGEGVAAQVGPMLKDSFTAANGAVQQIDAAGRIVKAIDSGKIIAGPAAGLRMQVSQIGQILGVTGKDEAEVIARSRNVIRGLAEMTLQGRKQMTGQGAITESEGLLAEKANSGRIEDLTPAEIRQLANASARAAKFVYGQHQSMLENLQSDPATVGLSKFYKPMPLPNFNFDPPSQDIHAQAAAILGGK